MSPPPTITCKRFDDQLDPYLCGDLPLVERGAMRSHEQQCARCRSEATDARRIEAMVATSFETPSMPRGLSDRIVDALRAEQQGQGCESWREPLAAWLEGDLSDHDNEALLRHLDECGRCADERRVGAAVQDALPLWTAPDPPAGFADRVAARTGSRRPTSVRWWAAAAALMFAAVGLGALVADRPADLPRSTADLNEVMDRFQSDLDARMHAVVHEQMPGFLGSFDRQPMVAGHVRRPTGNAFHRALQETKASRGRGSLGR